MSRAVKGRRSAMRKATRESWRISLSASCDTGGARLPHRVQASLGGYGLSIEVLVRRAVVAVRQGRALAWLAFARGRAAAGDAAVEGAGLDLLLDEGDRGGHSLVHRPGHLRLARDREVAADVLEERLVRPCEIVRIGCEPFHRLLARMEDCLPVLQPRVGSCIGINEILDGAITGP